MKRIYISFFTTVTIALMMTLIAFITRDEISLGITMDKNTQQVEQDSTFPQLHSSLKTFN